MKVKVKVYDGVKYNADSKKIAETEYDNVERFEVVSDSKTVAEIERCHDEVDENHEYLILYFENGENSTYRNSHVDLFRI